MEGGQRGFVRHVPREAIGAAHVMAHSETRWDLAEVWFDRPLVFLLDKLKLDDVLASIV
ncbi:unnamed protein product [Linum tenue]|uniref:Uncharacterized protein n=1 Tax=Linum tenue TaxID=586396 RepID=A0AAV0KS20_9ROSI|nr:unnamed protein product [Linum tenue]CAI0424985.1 unnamed protein product [Linum tenue]